MLKMLVKVTGIPKVDIRMYERNFNVEELMDWISLLDKYFDFDEVEAKKKVNIMVTRLKGGHAAIWWE